MYFLSTHVFIKPLLVALSCKCKEGQVVLFGGRGDGGGVGGGGVGLCVTCFKVCTPAIKLPMDASDRAGSSQDKAMPPHAYWQRERVKFRSPPDAGAKYPKDGGYFSQQRAAIGNKKLNANSDQCSSLWSNTSNTKKFRASCIRALIIRNKGWAEYLHTALREHLRLKRERNRKMTWGMGGGGLTLSEGLSTGDINRSAQRKALFTRTQPQPGMLTNTHRDRSLNTLSLV